MLQNFWATSFSVAACTVFATPAVLAQAETPSENHANYASHWLYIQTYTTAPSYTLEPTVGNPEGAADLAHQQKVLDTYGLTRATMDQAPLDIKIKLIKGNNYSFVESEATGSQVIPMPTLEACRTAGSIAVDRLTMPSTMTMARFSCLPGR